MDLKHLKKELKRLESVESRLLNFLIEEPDHAHIAVKKIFEVAGLIVSLKEIIQTIKEGK
jgi:hypothetical protein